MTLLRFSIRSLLLALTLYLCYLYIGEGWYVRDWEKPFVYRQFLPLLAWALGGLLTLPESTATHLLIFLSAVGLEQSSRYLYQTVFPHSPGEDLFVLLHVLLTFLLASFSKHQYDIPTAFFFTLALALLKAMRIDAFCYLLPIIAFHRETAFILIGLFAVYYQNKLSPRTTLLLSGILTGAYVGVQIFLRWIFLDAPLAPVLQTIPTFLSFNYSPIMLHWVILSHLMIFLLVLALLLARWTRLPFFLKKSALIVLPSLGILYLVWGQPFEWRVFLEGLPILLLIGVPHAD